MVPGPQVSGPDARTLLIHSAIGPPSTITMTAGANRFVVPLPAGASEIELTPQDGSELPGKGSSPRPIIAALADLRTSVVEPPVRGLQLVPDVCTSPSR
jgi:hypothetical protein